MSLIKVGEGDCNELNKVEKPEIGTTNPHPISLSIVFGDSKQVANKKLEELPKKLSASLSRPNVTVQTPPGSAKLPRKPQSHNSETYFPFAQEDSNSSDFVQLKSSPFDRHSNVTRPILIRHIRPPNNDAFRCKHTSKITIQDDSTLSTSELFSLRPVFNMSLNNANYSFLRDVHRCQSYDTLWQTSKNVIKDASPEEQFYVSSLKFNILSSGNGFNTLERSKSSYLMRRLSPPSETTDYLFQKYSPNIEALFIYDSVDKESNNSSTDTYTIANHQPYLSKESEQELIFEFSDHVFTEEPNIDISVRSPLASNTILDLSKSKDKNIVDILSCYELSTENDVANQTPNCLLETTGIYWEKIFARPLPKLMFASDYGNFTSVTTLRVMSTDNLRDESNMLLRRRCSHIKSETDQTGDIYGNCRCNGNQIWIREITPTISNTTYTIE